MINAAANARLFISAATNVFLFNIACKKLLASPAIDVLIESFNKQFLESLTESQHLTCHESISFEIEKFGVALSRVFSVALLFYDNNSRKHQVRSQSGGWKKTPVLHFLVK